MTTESPRDEALRRIRGADSLAERLRIALQSGLLSHGVASALLARAEQHEASLAGAGLSRMDPPLYGRWPAVDLAEGADGIWR